MNALTKKALLTSIFTSAVLLAGCDHKPKGPPPHYYTETEVTAAATKAFAANGDSIVTNKTCSLSNPDMTVVGQYCTYDVAGKTDIGLTRTAMFQPESNTITIDGCSWRDNDPAADKALQMVDDDFRRDMRAKAKKMGFRVLDNIGDENNNLSWDAANKSCYSAMSATFLLKQDGKLYTADFSESFSLPAGAGSGIQVDNLEAVAPKSAKKAAADDGDTGAADQEQTATTSSPEQETSTRKPPSSNLCVGTCTGPHIDLRDGKLKMNSMGGVGLKLY